MDLIQGAMERGAHISGNEKLDSQTWEMFMENAAGKRVFLFGTGAGAEYFFKNYVEIKLEGVIDNDAKKNGFCADDFIGEAIKARYGRAKISPPEALKRYNADDVSVLITSTNYYLQMIDELEAMGIKNYFVMLMLEADKRIKSGYTPKDDAIPGNEAYVRDCCRQEIKKNKIIFFSFGTYSDHGKYITEALLKIRKDLDIAWVVSDMASKLPYGVRKIYLGNWKRYTYEMETAKVWVFNMPVSPHIIKRPEQIYIQTKHWASVTLKRFYLDAKRLARVEENAEYWRQDGKKMDYIITGSDFDTQSSRRGFDFHKEVLQIGSPRSDAMFQAEEKKKKVYSHYGLDQEKRMLLYAPTYRYDKNRGSAEKPMPEIREINCPYEGVRNALKKRFGGEWYIALRLHPGHEKEIARMKLPEYVINLSNYEDGEEAAAACDIMISDYSSIMFEPAFVRKPVFLFATDKKDYIGNENDLLIDYDTLPFPIAESGSELIKNIECFSQDEYEKNLDAFMDKYGICEDGHASERAAGIISELINAAT